MESMRIRPEAWHATSPDGSYWAFSVFPMGGEIHYTVLCGGYTPCHGIVKYDRLVDILDNVMADTTRHYIKVWISECCRDLE